MKQQISEIHLWIYRRLLNRKTNPLTTEYVLKTVRFYTHHLQVTVHYNVLKQMEREGLIKRINKRTYHILYTHRDLVKDFKDMREDPLGIC